MPGYPGSINTSVYPGATAMPKGQTLTERATRVLNLAAEVAAGSMVVRNRTALGPPTDESPVRNGPSAHLVNLLEQIEDLLSCAARDLNHTVEAL